MASDQSRVGQCRPPDSRLITALFARRLYLLTYSWPMVLLQSRLATTLRCLPSRLRDHRQIYQCRSLIDMNVGPEPWPLLLQITVFDLMLAVYTFDYWLPFTSSLTFRCLAMAFWWTALQENVQKNPKNSQYLSSLQLQFAYMLLPRPERCRQLSKPPFASRRKIYQLERPHSRSLRPLWQHLSLVIVNMTYDLDLRTLPGQRHGKPVCQLSRSNISH